MLDQVQDAETAVQVSSMVVEDAQARNDLADEIYRAKPCNREVITLLKNAAEDYETLIKIGQRGLSYKPDSLAKRIFEVIIEFGQESEKAQKAKLTKIEDAMEANCSKR